MRPAALVVLLLLAALLARAVAYGSPQAGAAPARYMAPQGTPSGFAPPQG